jgi:hypothetical protein
MYLNYLGGGVEYFQNELRLTPSILLLLSLLNLEYIIQYRFIMVKWYLGLPCYTLLNQGPGDGGSKYLRNVGKPPRDSTVQ